MKSQPDSRRPEFKLPIALILLLLSAFLCPAPLAAASTEPLKIVNVYNWSGEINFDFSSDLLPDNKKLKEFIEIVPAIDFTCNSISNNAWIEANFKAGEAYRITLKKGLPAEKEECVLARDFAYAFIAPDKYPDVEFASSGVFMQLNAPVWELPFTSVNTGGKVQFSSRSVYPSTLLSLLSGGDYHYAANRYSRRLREGIITIDSPRNLSTATALDLRQAGIPKDKPGIYQLKLKILPYGSESSRLLVVTDLGIFASRNGNECQLFVRSLTSPAKPVPSINLALYSDKSQLIGTATTDVEGRARITIPEFTDREDYPSLLIANDPANGDIAFLRLPRNASGFFNSPAAPLAFCFTDRGICRPGEEMQLTAALRDLQNGHAIAKGTPVELAVTDPAGNDLFKATAVTDESGVVTSRFPVPANAVLGTCTLHVRQPGAGPDVPEYAACTFIVGEFMPDQIRATARGSVSDSAQLNVNGNASYYFGRPVPNAKVKVSLALDCGTVTPPQELKDFIFGCPGGNTLFSSNFDVTSNENGEFKCTQDLAFLATSPAKYPALPIRITAAATVIPAGGTRPVSCSTTLTHHFAQRYIGAKHLPSEGAATAKFRLAAVKADGTIDTIPAQSLKYTLERASWQFVVKNNGRTYSRVWERILEAVKKEAAAELTADNELSLSMPAEGNYILTLLDAESGQLLHRQEFWHHAGASQKRSPNPSVLEFSLNGDKFAPGDTAEITFDSEFAGTAMVFSGARGLTGECTVHQVRAGSNTISVGIPLNLTQGSWFVGINVAGTITTGKDGIVRDAPFASGIAMLPVLQNTRLLEVAMEAPATARPGSKVNVTLKLSDRSKRPHAGTVQLWGVDEGILSLTGYKTPDPFTFFFANTDVPLAMDSIYPELYPQLRVVNGKIGGGAAAPPMKSMTYKHQNGSRLPSGAVCFGTFRAGEDGIVNAEAEIPQFNGELRLMAVAFSDTAVGSSEQAVTVSDAVIASILAPSFVAPGDSFTVRASIFNRELEAGEIRNLKWEVTDAICTPVEDSPTFTLDKGGEKVLSCNVTIPETCVGEVTISLSGFLRAIPFKTSFKCTVRTPAPPAPQVSHIALLPGESNTFTLNGPGESALIGTLSERLKAHLDWLHFYPYSCLEQITSTAFPRLYTPLLVKQGLLPEHALETDRNQVAITITGINAKRTYNGWYSMWDATGEAWQSGSIYAMLFQLEADRCDFPLPAEKRAEFIKKLREYCNNRKNPLPERAIATYTLAMADQKLGMTYANLLPRPGENEAMPFSSFMTAMTLLKSGNAAEGNHLLQLLEEDNAVIDLTRGTGTDELDSALRRFGIALWALCDLMPEHPLVMTLADRLRVHSDCEDLTMSTQDHAWTAIALAKLAVVRPGALAPESAITVTTASSPAAKSMLKLDQPVTLKKPDTYTLTNIGKALVLANRISRSGTPVECASGFTVTRQYLDKDGNPVSTCRVGDLITVKIHVKLEMPVRHNMVMVDLLPGGFEIEDERLLTRIASRNGKLTATGLTTRQIERCYDRLLWFGDFTAGEATLTYNIRAMAAGSYRIPPFQIESMYSPEMRAVKFHEKTHFTVEN